MLLRSSSTPVLGSLLHPSSFSEAPNKDFDISHKHTSSAPDHHLNKISFLHGSHHNFSAFSCNSSPITSSINGVFFELDRDSNSSRGFRRARSAGNLEGLAAASCDEMQDFVLPLRSLRRSSGSILRTIPSFSIYNLTNEYENEEEVEDSKDEIDGELGEKDGLLERSVTIGDNIMALGGSGEFSFGKNMDLIEEEEVGLNEMPNLSVEEVGEPLGSSLFLARGLGIDVGFGGGGSDFTQKQISAGEPQDGSNIEKYYKQMVIENPCNPLFLRNYAQFLYQTKGDLQGAEEYYSRALLSDPGDGEILSQYAKIIWELHRDYERASGYFERAVQVAPEDSHILAAYASFLWETENEEEEEDIPPQGLVGVPYFQYRAMSSSVTA
ncbi:hypothetical protein GIB67_024681 [Kingdonia uniflora]|uniref:Uncharacterized protein n=1 Tax=Kingdonia uniflora TaxID=39325 RepID=A0A7J7LPN0_9MAGN|nr:hypothetical protein GIB67_024681 [Kingdonia uniflora]